MASFESGLSLIIDFAEKNGHASPIKTFIFCGFPLGEWVSSQKVAYRMGKLSQVQVKILESLPGWSWNVFESKWKIWINLLHEYVQKYGTADVPKYYTVDGRHLGEWVKRIRSEKRIGKLNDDRIVELEKIDGWIWNEPRPFYEWDKNIAYLIEYQQEFGDTLVPCGYNINGFNFGSWVRWVRINYKNNKTSKELVYRMEQIPNWSWYGRKTKEQSWDEWIKLLDIFIETYGNSDVPTFSKVNGKKLGRWVSRVRGKYHTGKLSRDKIATLNLYPGWVWRKRSKTIYF